ncbi:MAG: XdhC family protein [Cyclobacteriaceae bacterium]|nr:XdhC family protein [Cyclobacteriaceae bacterium]MDW8330620.1 XdhC family protein [Cyclobacteriaceae bacterium]
MKELKSIVEAYRQNQSAQRKQAVATVVRVHGSAYRSPGARMLIFDDGRWVGSISGGCLEGDALRKARTVMTEGKSLLITYDTREESNQQLGIGLGCNGVIDVLIEPVLSTDPNNPLSIFERIIERNEPVAFATVLTGELIGEKMLLFPDGSIFNGITDDKLSVAVSGKLQTIFSEPRSHTAKVNDEEVFLEWIQPVINLLIFGGGFDARPVCAFAKQLGWNVQVTDECVSHIAPVFFPQADKLTLCQRTFIDREFSITPFTACVLMSHNYEYDRDVLKKILRSATPYIGIIGPRKRFEKMRNELEQQGVLFNADDLHRIHAPAGLDIGAETPDEIALSILAEIQSKFTGRSGGFLKYRSGPIHQRNPKSDEVCKQVLLTNPLAKTGSQ